MIKGSCEITLDIFDRISQASDRALDEILAEAGRDGVEEARRNSRVKTGHLRSRNQLLRHRQHDYELLNDAPYADYLNSGTNKISADHFFDLAVQKTMQSIFDKARTFESRLK